MAKPKIATGISIRNAYLSRLRILLQEIYKASPADTETRGQKQQRISGFVEAVLISRVLTKSDIQTVINSEHQRAYGLTIEERRSIQNEILAACEHDNWSSFEEPTFRRKKPKRTVKQTQPNKSKNPSPMKDAY